MTFNLQLFAKRGDGSSGKDKQHKAFVASSGGVIENEQTTHIETIYRDRRGGFGSYDDEILEAKADKDGNVTFSYAKGEFSDSDAKSNVRKHVSFDIVAGAKNGQTFNINWDKVNSIKGQTYSLREQARKAGLKWDANKKMWRR